MSLSERELVRYKHLYHLPEIGEDGMERIRRSGVLIVGIGSLGAPAVQYLSAAGVGLLGLADYGVLQESDLPRLPQLQTQDVFKHKAKALCSRLFAMNPMSKHYPLLLQVNTENAAQLVKSFEIVLDCSQDAPTHLLLNDVCQLQGKTLIAGEVSGTSYWTGNFLSSAAASYRCALPVIEGWRKTSEGAWGLSAGMAGLDLAQQVLKYIVSPGDPGICKLRYKDAWREESREKTVERNEHITAAVEAAGILQPEEYGMTILPPVED